LEVRHVGIVIDCLIEIVDFFIGEYSVRMLKKLMIVVEAELRLAVVQFIGVAIVMIFEGLEVLFLGVVVERGEEEVVSTFAYHHHVFVAALKIFLVA
jgi:hypothetical protein